MWPEPSEEEGRSPIPCPSLLLGKQSPPLQPTFSHQYPPPEAPATAGGVLRDPPVPPPPPKRSVTKSLGQGVGSRQPTALLSPVVGNAAGMLWDPKGSAPGSGDSWKLSRPLGPPGEAGSGHRDSGPSLSVHRGWGHPGLCSGGIPEVQVSEAPEESLDRSLQQKARDFSRIWKEVPGSGPWAVPGCPLTRRASGTPGLLWSSAV